MSKEIIYQMLPRLWGNIDKNNQPNGSIEENGCGKFSSIDSESLEYIKSLGATCVWYTGILRHATACGTHGCVPSSSDWVKGKAGSPYSITDYYDVIWRILRRIEWTSSVHLYRGRMRLVSR